MLSGELKSVSFSGKRLFLSPPGGDGARCLRRIEGLGDFLFGQVTAFPQHLVQVFSHL